MLLSEIPEKPAICVSVGNCSFEDIPDTIKYAKSKKAECVEIRFDLIKDLKNNPNHDKISKIASFAKENNIVIIAAYRNKEKHNKAGKTSAGVNKKPAFLKKLVESGITALDVELDLTEKPAIADIVKFAHSKNAEIILSVHDFNSSGDIQKTLQFYLEAAYFGADFFKMAVMPDCREEALEILLINTKIKEIMASDPKNYPKFTIFGMGDNGKITRVLSLLYGSFMAYCPSPFGLTAPGQIDIDNFQRLYSSLSAI